VVLPFSSTFSQTFIEKWRNPLPALSGLRFLCTDDEEADMECKELL